MKKLLIAIILVLLTYPAMAQEKDSEIKSEIQALTDFHKVVYQIWHTGWPQKDIKLLSSVVPELQKGHDEIIKVELPGILRDKKAQWDEAVKKLSGSLTEYETAVAKKDSVEILNSAEKLHMRYEMLVRVVRPKLKEFEAFHQVLYILYHYYSPENQYDKIKEAVAQLKEKSVLISKAKLSVKQKTKEEIFNKLNAELIAAVNNLDVVVNVGNNKKNIQDAVETMHSKYEVLEKVFD